MWAYVRGSSATKPLLIFHGFRYTQAMFIFTFSAGVTLASVMAWSIAWFHLDWCVLMEYFLKWCAKTLHHYFSKYVSTKSWPYKSANKMPCIGQCVYILFLVLGKIYSFWKNCLLLLLVIFDLIILTQIIHKTFQLLLSASPWWILSMKHICLFCGWTVAAI